MRQFLIRKIHQIRSLLAFAGLGQLVIHPILVQRAPAHGRPAPSDHLPRLGGTMNYIRGPPFFNRSQDTVCTETATSTSADVISALMSPIESFEGRKVKK